MLLFDYGNRHFFKADGTYDLTTNVEVITRLTVERYHLHLNGEKTIFGENMVFLPFDYLCAKSLETGEILRSENTFTIHHFAGSWLPEETRRYITLHRKYYTYYAGKGIPESMVFFLCRFRAAYEVGHFLFLLKKVIHLK